MSEIDGLNVNKTIKFTSLPVAATQLSILVFIFFLMSRYSYPLFHVFVEIFTAIVACTIFAITWSSRRFIDNNFLLVLGVSMFFVAVIDTLHAFAYSGNNIIPGSTANMATQLWLAARLISSLSFIFALYFSRRKIDSSALFLIYFISSLLLITSIVHWRIFPASFIDGVGLTAFKITTEYFIVTTYLAAILLLHRQRAQFDSRFFKLIILSISLMIVCELFFTNYLNPFDFSNFTGHLFKVAAYYFLYLGLLETGLMKPYRILFKNLKDRELSLTESESHYRALVENSPNTIILHIDKIIEYINPAGLRLLNITDPKELLGKNIMDLVHDGCKRLVAERIGELNDQAKQTKMTEIRIITPDKQILDVEAISNLANYKGQKAIQSIWNNITNRKHFEHQVSAYTKKIEEYAEDLRKFKLAVENVSDAIYMTDKNFKLVYTNIAAEKISGYFQHELIGQDISLWHDLTFDNPDASFFATLKEALSNKQSLRLEVNNRRKNGEKYLAQLEITPVLDERNDIAIYVIIERDITRQKEIDNAKNEFVSLASHQLRTPLASITLSSELFLRGVYGEINEKQAEMLREIFNSCGNMKDLISELLNISRIEMGTFDVKKETLNLGELLSELSLEHELLINNKQITFEKAYPDEPLYMQLDKNILKILIDNLLSNALRYTKPGGQISLGFNLHNDDVIIWVKDTGCGIPANQQGRIFNKLFRADNAQSISADGSGLGLYMAKTVLKKINGRIWVESVENQGSTFFVRLPLHD